jgi:hypothetical protein
VQIKEILCEMRHLPENLKSLKLPSFEGRELLLRWQWAPETVDVFLCVPPQGLNSFRLWANSRALYFYIRDCFTYLRSDASLTQEPAWQACEGQLVDLWLPSPWVLEQDYSVSCFLKYVPFRILILPAYEAFMRAASCHFLWRDRVCNFFKLINSCRLAPLSLAQMRKVSLLASGDAFRFKISKSVFHAAYRNTDRNPEYIRRYLGVSQDDAK